MLLNVVVMYLIFIAAATNIGQKKVRKIKPEEIKALVMVKSIYLESNISAGAKIISGIATTRSFSLSRYVATRLMKE